MVQSFRDSDHADSINVRLTRLAQALPYGIAAEPDPGRQLQEKAGGVTPAGLFSLGGRGLIRHCEERLRRSKPFFLRAVRWIASAFAKASADKSRSLSSGAHSRDPLARNDGFLTSVIGFPLYLLSGSIGV